MIKIVIRGLFKKIANLKVKRDHQCTLLGRRVRERAELFYAHDEDIAALVSNSATSIQPTQTKPLLAI